MGAGYARGVGPDLEPAPEGPEFLSPGSPVRPRRVSSARSSAVPKARTGLEDLLAASEGGAVADGMVATRRGRSGGGGDDGGGGAEASSSGVVFAPPLLTPARLEEARTLAGSERTWAEAERLLAAMVGSVAAGEEEVRVKEAAVGVYGDVLVSLGRAEELALLLERLRPFFEAVSKAKTAKLVRHIIDQVSRIPGTNALQIRLCIEVVAWCREEKRTFLRQRVESRLSGLYIDTKEYAAALALVETLLREVKRLDDKLLLLEVHLTEARVHSALRDQPRAKAALAAARTAANAIYVPPVLQGTIDLQSGTLHADEHDYKTAYSYFFEALEQLSALDDPRAPACLKYMLLCKIMQNEGGDVPGIVNSKIGMKYASNDGVEAMREVAAAHLKRDLKLLEEIVSRASALLVDDAVVGVHLAELRSDLMEQNLSRLIEPYSTVEISHLASLINLPQKVVETKLSQMILDKKLAGVLDQGTGWLIVFEDDDDAKGKAYPKVLNIISSMGNVVDALYARGSKLHA